jgi:hypothetical protein
VQACTEAARQARRQPGTDYQALNQAGRSEQEIRQSRAGRKSGRKSTAEVR